VGSYASAWENPFNIGRLRERDGLSLKLLIESHKWMSEKEPGFDSWYVVFVGQS